MLPRYFDAYKAALPFRQIHVQNLRVSQISGFLFHNKLAYIQVCILLHAHGFAEGTGAAEQKQPKSLPAVLDEFSNAALVPCPDPAASLEAARMALKAASAADRLTLDWQAQNLVSGKALLSLKPAMLHYMAIRG